MFYENMRVKSPYGGKAPLLIPIKTNYYIIKDRYQVYVTYTLVDDQTLKAEFKGSLKNEFYYKKIKYKRVKLN